METWSKCGVHYTQDKKLKRLSVQTGGIICTRCDHKSRPESRWHHWWGEASSPEQQPSPANGANISPSLEINVMCSGWGVAPMHIRWSPAQSPVSREGRREGEGAWCASQLPGAETISQPSRVRPHENEQNSITMGQGKVLSKINVESMGLIY